MTFQPYNVVPGTQILHSLTDVYELTDEAEEMVYRVELNADNAGVYIRSSEKGIEEGSKTSPKICLSATKNFLLLLRNAFLNFTE